MMTPSVTVTLPPATTPEKSSSDGSDADVGDGDDGEGGGDVVAAVGADFAGIRLWPPCEKEEEEEGEEEEEEGEEDGEPISDPVGGGWKQTTWRIQFWRILIKL